MECAWKDSCHWFSTLTLLWSLIRAAAMSVTVMPVTEGDVGSGVTHLEETEHDTVRPCAVSLSSLVLCQHSTVMAKVRHVAHSGRSWINLCCDLCKEILRLPVWHLKQGSRNYYFCLLLVCHFGTIMWTESSVKQSYDNLYSLNLFHHQWKASLLPLLSSSHTQL